MNPTTPEEIAKEIVREWVITIDEGVLKPTGRLSALTAAITTAISNERERCAKVAEKHIWRGPSAAAVNTDTRREAVNSTAKKIATAIREGK